MTASDVARARANLADLLDRLPGPTPCQVDPDPFTSARRRQREEAAEACRRGCPALAACGAYAEAAGEQWLVWGGRDRTNPSFITNHARKRVAS